MRHYLKDFIERLENFIESFDFSNLNKGHELFSNQAKKVFGKFEKKTLRKTFLKMNLYV